MPQPLRRDELLAIRLPRIDIPTCGIRCQRRKLRLRLLRKLRGIGSRKIGQRPHHNANGHDDRPRVRQKQLAAIPRAPQQRRKPRPPIRRHLHNERRPRSRKQRALKNHRQHQRRDRPQGVHRKHDPRLQHRSIREDGRDDDEIHREPRRAAHERGDHDRRKTIAPILNRPRRQNPRDRARITRQQRNKTLPVQPHLRHDSVHDERRSSHVPAVLQRPEEEKQNADLREETEHRPNSRKHPVHNQRSKDPLGQPSGDRLAQRQLPRLNETHQRVCPGKDPQKKQQHHRRKDHRPEYTMRHNAIDSIARPALPRRRRPTRPIGMDSLKILRDPFIPRLNRHARRLGQGLGQFVPFTPQELSVPRRQPRKKPLRRTATRHIPGEIIHQPQQRPRPNSPLRNNPALPKPRRNSTDRLLKPRRKRKPPFRRHGGRCQPRQSALQHVNPSSRRRNCGNHLNTEQLRELAGIDQDRALLRLVDHVERNHHRPAELNDLRGKVKLPFQIARIDHNQDGVRRGNPADPTLKHVARNLLIRRSRGKTVNPGKIDECRFRPD